MRRCLNCGIETHKGLQCQRCDKVLYISWMFADFHPDPEIRLKFLQEQERENINSPETLKRVAEQRQAFRLLGFSKALMRMVYGLSPDNQINIYLRAIRAAKAKAEDEIKAREKAMLALTSGKDVVMADEVANKILNQNPDNYSRKNPEWSADYSKNQTAYAGFTPSNSEPEVSF